MRLPLAQSFSMKYLYFIHKLSLRYLQFDFLRWKNQHQSYYIIAVLRDNIGQLQEAAELSYKYSKAMAAKGIEISSDVAKRGKEIAEKSEFFQI